ncbi:site-specific integrase [Virgibacillus salexigens]|uniref:site-specific integrase n=1 Tax=Virgibacillus salexigens TaxID=61016 RepID=UPI00190D3066|nr:site-specific integrase [Virgibacillus salexigens]
MYCKKIKTKSGQVKWECVVDGPRDPATGRRKQITRRAKTQREAKKRAQDAVRSIDEDKIDENSGKRITFDQVASGWMNVYKQTGVKRSTVRIREKEVAILNRYMAKTPIANITYSMYQKFINDISPDYARTTVQGVNTSAGMIFQHAVKDKLIKESPNREVVIPRKRKTVEEIELEPIEQKFLTNDELNEFLNAVLQHGQELDIERFYLLAFSGMRSGELCALKWSDIDFETNTIRITKTLYNEDNNMRKYELTPPKTNGSIRSFEMDKKIMQLIKSHYRRQKKIRMKYRSELEHDGNFVFCRANGYPYIQKNIVTRMARLLEYTNIEKKATPHIFRHTHISMLAEAGVDLATVMERVGHDDPQTTLKIYTHVTKKMKKDASAKVSNFYENTLSNINL